jgi:hypothetical protein
VILTTSDIPKHTDITNAKDQLTATPGYKTTWKAFFSEAFTTLGTLISDVFDQRKLEKFADDFEEMAQDLIFEQRIAGRRVLDQAEAYGNRRSRPWLARCATTIILGVANVTRLVGDTAIFLVVGSILTVEAVADYVVVSVDDIAEGWDTLIDLIESESDSE